MTSCVDLLRNRGTRSLNYVVCSCLLSLSRIHSVVLVLMLVVTLIVVVSVLVLIVVVIVIVIVIVVVVSVQDVVSSKDLDVDFGSEGI